MITLKIKYSSSKEFQELLLDYRKQQSSLIRSAFKRLQGSYSQKELTKYLNDMDNIDLDSWWKQSAVQEAKTIFSTADDKKVIFGGKNNLKRYVKGLITKEEYKSKRLFKLVSSGQADSFGNRKFRLNIKNSQIVFSDKNNKIKHILHLQPQLRDRLEQLQWIEDQTKEKKQSLSVKVDETYIYLTFEPKKKEETHKIGNRMFAIDTNPDSIGWSVVDVINGDPICVDSGVILLDKLNEQHKNKKHHETFEICKFLVNKAIHYKCSQFAVEDLNIKSKDLNKGKKTNKLVNNNWIRTDLFSNIQKRCFINNIKFVEVNPAYTSVIGGTIHRDYPDPIAPTFEIARRVYFKYQSGYFYPSIPNVNVLNEQWKQTLEKSFGTWKELSNWLKTSEYRYRVSLDTFKTKVFRFKSTKSTVSCRYLYV